MKNPKNVLNKLTVLSVSLFLLSITFLAFQVSANDDTGSNQMRNFRKNMGEKHQMFDRESIDKDVTITNDGLEIQITSTDDEIVTKIQDNKDKHEKFNKSHDIDSENIDVTVSNIDHGVLIKVSTSDSDTLETIHNHAKKMELMESLRDSDIDMQEAINKEVTNLDNGIRIELTSDNEDVVEILQMRQQNDDFMGHMGKPHKRGFKN